MLGSIASVFKEDPLKFEPLIDLSQSVDVLEIDKALHRIISAKQRKHFSLSLTEEEIM